MGSRYFTKVSKKGTKFLRYVVRPSLCPKDMCDNNLPSISYIV